MRTITCQHNRVDRELAVDWDGVCPLCLQTKHDRALALLRRSRGIVANALVMWGYPDQSDTTLVAEIDALLEPK